MAYDKEKEFERAKAIIKKDETIVFIDDLVCEMGIATSTFYKYFPAESEEMEDIKELLKVNKTKTKRKLRKQWQSVESSASLQISLYKLIATEKELERLNPPKAKEEGEGLPDKPKPLVEWTDDETNENE